MIGSIDFNSEIFVNDRRRTNTRRFPKWNSLYDR